VLLLAVIAAPTAVASNPATPAAPAPAARSTPEVVRTGTVDVRESTRREPLDAEPAPELSLVGRPNDPSAALDGTLERADGAVPPPPAFATFSGDGGPTLVGFDGLDDSANGPTFVEPADSAVAVGPNHAVQVVNTVMRVSERDGTGAEDIPLDVLFDIDDPQFPIPNLTG
jgi:hypothetical protein